jgi:hypothetical protein
MNRLRSLFLLPPLFVASSCATAKGTFEPLGPNHPANPKAAEVPIQDPAPFLRADGAVPHPGVAPPAQQDAASPAGAFVCPMHPEVSADQAGRCPKCGMNLVPREPKEHPHDG